MRARPALGAGVVDPAEKAEEHRERSRRAQRLFTAPLVQHARHRERELGDLRVEVRAVFRDHLVAALHGSHGRRDGCAARVFVALTGLDERLGPHDAESAHFLHLVSTVGDDPVPRDKLGGKAALITDRDGVREDEATAFLVGLRGDVLRLRRDSP